jgi:chromosome transmission fidelity protein 1
MTEANTMEKPKKDFGHPYEPYQIQDEMMNAIYDCIAKGQVGIFESPTGI